MFLLTKPNVECVQAFIENQRTSLFSYGEIGATYRSARPHGHTIDHNRVRLGTGEEIFDRAVESLRKWKMFDFSWVTLYFDTTPIKVDATVAILIKHFGFWSLNAARIVYAVEETVNEIDKFSFAYGTLQDHGEQGEERFSIEYHRIDGSVWYDLYAFSKPNHLLARLGYPASRYLQKRFAADSKSAMLKSIKI